MELLAPQRIVKKTVRNSANVLIKDSKRTSILLLFTDILFTLEEDPQSLRNIINTLKTRLWEGRIHAVTVGLTQGAGATKRYRLTDRVSVLRDRLLWFGVLLLSRLLSLLRLTGMHPTVTSTWESTIPTWGTLPSNTLTGILLLLGRLTESTELRDLLAELGDFGNQLFHFYVC